MQSQGQTQFVLRDAQFDVQSCALQIALSFIVIFLKSMTWAHQAAVLGWQAAILLIS